MTPPGTNTTENCTQQKRKLVGHRYGQVHIGDQARVQNGDYIADQITTNHNYYGVADTMRLQVSGHLEGNESDSDVRLAAANLAVTAMGTFGSFLLFLQRAFQYAAASLPMQMSCRLVSLEDAFGECKTLDVGLILDWTTFHFVLAQTFRNRPGYRRVLNANYRLANRSRSSVLIDPKHPPAFATVFAPGAYLQMSILFMWDEVSDEKCPRCGLIQACRSDADIICVRPGCAFMYRGQVDISHINELPDTPNDNEPAAAPNEVANLWRTNSLIGQTDKPAQFIRIGISKRSNYGNSEISQRSRDAYVPTYRYPIRTPRRGGENDSWGGFGMSAKERKKDFEIDITKTSYYEDSESSLGKSPLQSARHDDGLGIVRYNLATVARPLWMDPRDSVLYQRSWNDAYEPRDRHPIEDPQRGESDYDLWGTFTTTTKKRKRRRVPHRGKELEEE